MLLVIGYYYIDKNTIAVSQYLFYICLLNINSITLNKYIGI